MRCTLIRWILLAAGFLIIPFKVWSQCGVTDVVLTVTADSVNGSPVAGYLRYSATSVTPGWVISSVTWTINGSSTRTDSVFRFSNFSTAGVDHLLARLTVVNPATGDTCYAEKAGYYMHTAEQLFTTIETNGSGLTQFFTARYYGADPPQQPVWNFGDGTSASGFAVLHTFPIPGVYPVTFSTGNGSVGNAVRRIHAGDGRDNPLSAGTGFMQPACDSVSLLPLNTVPYTQISYDDPFNYLYFPAAGILNGQPIGLGQWSAAPTTFNGAYQLAGQTLLCSKMQDGVGGDYTIYQPVIIQDSCFTTSDTLTGIFWEDTDADGIRDSGEPFFSEPGYTMRVISNEAAPDQKGAFTLPLPPFAAPVFPVAAGGDEFSTPPYFRHVPSGQNNRYRFNAGVVIQQSGISGKMYKDVDADTVFSSGVDRTMEGFTIAIVHQQSGAVYRSVTDANGNFNTIVPDGIYKIYPETPLQGCNIIPDTQYVVINGIAAGITPFAVQTTVLTSDLEAILIPERTPVAGDPFTLYLLARNNGNDTCKGQFQVVYDNNLQFQSFYPANGIHDPVAHTVTWYSQTLYPFTDSLYRVHLILPASVTADSLINQGYLFASPGFTDVNLNNNAYACTTKVGQSTAVFSKMVVPEGTGGPRYIHAGERLYYHLRYVNEGPGRKAHVILQDEVSLYCMMSSLRIEYSNRKYRLTTRGRQLTFQYYDVNLTDTSVSDSAIIDLIFSLTTSPFSPPGSLVNNTASVYADQEPLLLSNTVSQTIDLTAMLYDHQEMGGVIYPNPCTDYLIVPASENTVISLSDLAGRAVAVTTTCQQEKYILRTADLSPGVYLVTIKSGAATVTRRLVKQ